MQLYFRKQTQALAQTACIVGVSAFTKCRAHLPHVCRQSASHTDADCMREHCISRVCDLPYLVRPALSCSYVQHETAQPRTSRHLPNAGRPRAIAAHHGNPLARYRSRCAPPDISCGWCILCKACHCCTQCKARNCSSPHRHRPPTQAPERPVLTCVSQCQHDTFTLCQALQIMPHFNTL